MSFARTCLLLFLFSAITTHGPEGRTATGTPQSASTDTSKTRPCTPATKDEKFAVDFRDARLVDIARLVSCAAEMNIIFEPPQLGNERLTVIAPRPVTLKTLKQLFEHALVKGGFEWVRRHAYRVIRRAH